MSFARSFKVPGRVRQMDVPKKKVALYSWVLSGELGTASGRVLSVSDEPGPAAIAAGLSPGQEYWFIDVEVDTGPAEMFHAVAVKVGSWDSAYPSVAATVFVAEVVPEARPATTADLPTAGLLIGPTPAAVGGSAGHAALVFEVRAGGATLPPAWFWSPDAGPHLFGDGPTLHESITLSRPAPGGPLPGTGWCYAPHAAVVVDRSAA
jgi:hypothetical protein